MDKHWNAVEVLRHARHDWLNRLQLIKGYLSLNNIDRVKEIVEETIADAEQESMLSNMNIPEFASLLFLYNWENHKIHLEYEIVDKKPAQNLSVDDRFLTNWTQEFLNILDASVDEDVENYLSITLEREGEGLRFFFDFRGRIDKEASLAQFLQNCESVVKKIHTYNKEELVVELFLPFAAQE